MLADIVGTLTIFLNTQFYDFIDFYVDISKNVIAVR